MFLRTRNTYQFYCVTKIVLVWLITHLTSPKSKLHIASHCKTHCIPYVTTMKLKEAYIKLAFLLLSPLLVVYWRFIFTIFFKVNVHFKEVSVFHHVILVIECSRCTLWWAFQILQWYKHPSVLSVNTRENIFRHLAFYSRYFYGWFVLIY